MLRKEEAQHQPLDLNDVVEESLRLMRSDLLNRGVTVGTDLAVGAAGRQRRPQPAAAGAAELPDEWLRCHGRSADRTAGCRCSTRATAPGHVEIAVSDRGTGISPADLERIFEPFVTTKAKGLGLGLAICRSIVEAHGGRLWATNNADRGATLHCELPAMPR